MNIFTSALSGAQAAQIALDTASQNVANVMTPGYTRQGTLMTSVAPSRKGAQAAGDGVRVPALIRFSDGYKSLQMWQAASQLGQRTAGQLYLGQLEQVMGAEESGIGGGLDEFFAALNAASVEPTSSPLRQQVISAADALAQRFNSLQQVLANQRSAIDQQRSAGAMQAGALSGDIASLNQKIASLQASGGNTSALVDSRDQKIDALASLVAVQVCSLVF